MNRKILSVIAAVLLLALGFYFGTAFQKSRSEDREKSTASENNTPLPGPAIDRSQQIQAAQLWSRIAASQQELEALGKKKLQSVDDFKKVLIAEFKLEEKVQLSGKTLEEAAGSVLEMIRNKQLESANDEMKAGLAEKAQEKINILIADAQKLEKEYKTKLKAHQDLVVKNLGLTQIASNERGLSGKNVSVQLFTDLVGTPPESFTSKEEEAERAHEAKLTAALTTAENKVRARVDQKWGKRPSVDGGGGRGNTGGGGGAENRRKRLLEIRQRWDSDKAKDLRRQLSVAEATVRNTIKRPSAQNEDLSKTPLPATPEAAKDWKVLSARLNEILPPGWKNVTPVGGENILIQKIDS